MAAAISQVVSALVGVTVGGTISLVIFRATVRRQGRNDLREQLLEIIDLQSETDRLLANSDDPDFDRLSRATNSKKQIRLAMARELANRQVRKLTSHDCCWLGYQCDLNGEYLDGRRFIQLGVEKSRSAVQKAEALRFLANHYAGRGPDFDLSKANALYAECVETTAGDDRPYFVHLTGYAYRRWAQTLKALGDAGWQEKALEAQRLLDSLPPTYRGVSAELKTLAELLEHQRSTTAQKAKS